MIRCQSFYINGRLKTESTQNVYGAKILQIVR